MRDPHDAASVTYRRPGLPLGFPLPVVVLVSASLKSSPRSLRPVRAPCLPRGAAIEPRGGLPSLLCRHPGRHDPAASISPATDPMASQRIGDRDMGVQAPPLD